MGGAGLNPAAKKPVTALTLKTPKESKKEALAASSEDPTRAGGGGMEAVSGQDEAGNKEQTEGQMKQMCIGFQPKRPFDWLQEATAEQRNIFMLNLR
eukprot:67787-Rhodomonas_salina.1